MGLQIKIIKREAQDQVFTHKELEVDVNIVCGILGTHLHDIHYPAPDMCVIEYYDTTPKKIQDQLAKM